MAESTRTQTPTASWPRPAGGTDSTAEPSPTASTPVASTPPTGPRRVKRTRPPATYAAIGVGLVLLILVLVFIGQNLHDASVHYLGASFRMPVGLIVLFSFVAGGVVVLAVSLARVLQLRLLARRHRTGHRHR